MLIFFIFIFIFGAAGLICYALTPMILESLHFLQKKRVDKAEEKLSTMFIEVQRHRLLYLYTLIPFILGISAFALSKNFLVTVGVVGIGAAIPAVSLRVLETRRRQRLVNQLVDAVMLLSSSLKGGLSLLQGIEVIVEEMPAPISQEFGLLLRENRLGISLDESLRRMHDRLRIEELTFLVSSLLVARETGGDLTKVLSRLAVTIRDNRRLKDSVNTLTMQGRLQGVIMSVLPIVFIFWVITFNREHFNIMLNTETGRILLMVAIVLQIVGMFLIRVFSSIKI